jgi:hypothetical protein
MRKSPHALAPKHDTEDSWSVVLPQSYYFLAQRRFQPGLVNTRLFGEISEKAEQSRLPHGFTI